MVQDSVTSMLICYLGYLNLLSQQNKKNKTSKANSPYYAAINADKIPTERHCWSTTIKCQLLKITHN